ncbi:MAG: tRNA-intron lyase, partial [Methanomassiliicoccales archaeon]
MPGELIEDSVILKDPSEASQIYNKGFFGFPLSGGGLELDLIESLYLVESGRLVVQRRGEGVPFSTLTREAARNYEDFEIKFIVYRDLRERGYVVKGDSGDFDFRVFPRGGTPSNSQTKYWVLAISERWIFDVPSYLEKLSRAERTRKELLLGVVDEEGDITFYRASRSDPDGYEDPGLEGSVEAHLVEDRVLVFDPEEGERLYGEGFFGKRTGEVLQLSLLETAYLMEEGKLRLRDALTGRWLSKDGFKRRAERLQPDFGLRLDAYRDMRKRGLVVKTGFKYGCHFRVYEKDPHKIHARY